MSISSWSQDDSRRPRVGPLYSAALLAVCLALASGATVAGQTAEQRPTLTWDVLFGHYAHGARPSQLEWSPNGQELVFLWSEALWLLSGPEGRSRQLVRLVDLGLPEYRTADGDLSGIHWTPDGESLLLTYSGDFFLYGVKSKRLDRLTDTEAEEEDPKFSSDGKHLIFVRGQDLFRLPLKGRREVALTRGGEENVTLHGKTDWVYWEELWGRSSTGYWPSPQDDDLAYYRFDETPVRSYPLVDFLHTYPKVREQKYPTAGETNPRVSVGVLDPKTRETVWMDTGDEDGYLARVTWTPDGDSLAIHRLNRAQNHLELLLCRPRQGGCSVVLEEKTSTWIDIDDDFAFLGGDRLVWGSDRDGWRRLYLYDLAGRKARLIRALTPEGLAVTSLDGINEEGGWLIYTGYRSAGLGAAERQVYRVDLESGAHQALAEAAGWNTALVAPGGRFWVHTWSDSSTLPVETLRRADGTAVATLPSEPAVGYDPGTLPQWEVFTIPGPKGVELPARLLKSNRGQAGSDERLPVIMYHYGCPASQVVENRWRSGPRDLWHRRMAQRGYLVFMVDNQASNFFGKRGAEAIHRRFGPPELAAQVAGVEYLKSRPDVDGSRIGLWGWSGGGSNTLYNLFRRPGLWKAGVAGAPVTSWRLYDTIWTERYLGHPKDNGDGYRQSSPLTFASQLRDGLLIVHGTHDDNVHPHNTLMLVQELIEAGIPFEQAIYPQQKHGFRGPHARHFHERMEDFFDRHLK